MSCSTPGVGTIPVSAPRSAASATADASVAFPSGVSDPSIHLSVAVDSTPDLVDPVVTSLPLRYNRHCVPESFSVFTMIPTL